MGIAALMNHGGGAGSVLILPNLSGSPASMRSITRKEGKVESWFTRAAKSIGESLRLPGLLGLCPSRPISHLGLICLHSFDQVLGCA